MVMLSKLKEKLGSEDMPMPGMEVEIEGEEMGEGEMPEAKPIDLSAVSDEELMNEISKRGLA
jgi:hypothetical protein